jgi:plastocyanin
MLCVGMPSSARRLLALAALAGFGGAVTAQAVAATGGAQAHAAAAAAAKKRTKAKSRTKARAVKLSGGVAWVPASVLAPSRPPLGGTTGGGNGSTSGGPASGNGNGETGGNAPPTTTTPTTPDPPPQQQALGATVDERTGYTMLLSRTTLTAGSVVVQLVNKGEDPHNLRIVRTSPSGGAPTDLPEAAPQQQSSKTLTLSSGTYYLYCTLTTPVSHEMAGMHATLRVDP